ncbi:unnamed protein product [Rotaria socialis]|uniref:F-box associated domain-containing protein n=1 Tax=Rotaria socialis TaxID=392032 RepID=A0A821NB30_9BILA|nr:unnamed protein product [Rotaria socialis]CAF4782798.1 unnamed protein product [Rotaria socialis]
MTEFINAEETTRQEIDVLVSAIRQIDTNMESIEKTCCKIDARDTFVFIKKLTEHKLDLLTLSPSYKTIARRGTTFISLTISDQRILMHQDPKLCLYDRNMNQGKQNKWIDKELWDMCWSHGIEKFIILGVKSIFLLDEHSMSIDHVYTIKGRKWLSCTCSNQLLYASTNKWGPSIMKFTLSPTMQLIKEWTHPVSCTEDEIIYDMLHKNVDLALLVDFNLDKSLRIELRSVETLDRIWSLDFGITRVQNLVFHFFSLTHNEWVAVDYQNRRLIQITKDGKIKQTVQYQTIPRHAIVVDMKKLVVPTDSVIHL